MTIWTLIRRTLRFHARAHLGVVLGAAVGSAALIGALVVGDSVRESLKGRELEGLGNAWAAMNMGDRFFPTELLDRMDRDSTNRHPKLGPNVMLGHPAMGP